MAGAPPAGGGAPAPPAALAAPAVAHGFTRCNIPGADNTLDYIYAPSGAKLLSAFPKLGWVDASSVAPGCKAAPALAVQGVTCCSAFGDWDGAALQPALALSELTASFSLAYMSRAADALDGLGLLDRVYHHFQSFLDALEVALPRVPSPSPFELGAGELEELSPFLRGGSPGVAAVAPVAAVLGRARVPAVRANAARGIVAVAAIPAVVARPAVLGVAAVPAVPPSGPAELQWWSLVQVGHTVDKQSLFPFALFCRRGLVALDRCSPIARADATSRVRAVADSLAGYLSAEHGGATGAAVLARLFRRTHHRILALPDELRSGSFDPDELEMELMDDVAYVSGDAARRDTITLGRLSYVQPSYPELADYLSRVGSAGAKATTLDRLSSVLTEAQVKLSLFSRLGPLNLFLAAHNPFLIQCWNKSLPVEGVDGVTSLLLKEHTEWKDSKPSVAPLTDALNDLDLVGTGRGGAALTEGALKRALVEDTRFVDAAEEISQLDLTDENQRIEAVEVATLSRCDVFHRFFAKPSSLINRHAVFGQLHQCIGDMGAHLGRAQAADPATGTIPKLRADWTFPSDLCALLFRGRISKLFEGLFNGVGGALALYNLTASEPFVEVPEDQLYVVESVLELLIPFARATFVGAGWNAVSTTGYTAASLLERQLEHVKWVRGMGATEVPTLLQLAQTNFKQALLDADLHVATLNGDPEPAKVVRDHLLKKGTCEFDKEINRKREGAEPLVIVRRAFPNLMPTSAPRSLPGVILDGGGGGPGPGPGKPGKPGDKKPGDKKPEDQPKPPGSAKSLASWTDDTHMRLGATIYDVEAIAKLYSLDVAEMCWPVLLTVKRGGHALCLCPQWEEPGHTSLTSKAHVRPKGWNITTIEKNHSAKAPGAPGKGPQAGDKRKQ